MTTTSFKYSDCVNVLAFIAMMKRRFANSVVFKRKAYQLANEIGLSDGRTAKKYLDLALELGVIQEHNETYIIHRWDRCCWMLVRGTGDSHRWMDIPGKDLKNLQDYKIAVEGLLVGANYNSQQFNINKKQSKNKINGRVNTSAMENVSKTDLHTIVTGCKHIAGITGRCQRTAAKRLRQWNKDGTVKTLPVVAYHNMPTLDFDKIDQIRKMDGNTGLVVPCMGHFRVIYGQRVVSFSMGLFKSSIK